MIDDETLILFAYGDELDEREQARIAAAIDADPALAARWRQLRCELDALRLVDDRAAPQLRVARWQRRLDAAARDETGARSTTGQRWLWPSAVAAALLVGIGLGVRLPGPPDDAATVVRAPANDDRPRAGAVRGLSAYLVRGREELARLANDGTVDDQQRAAMAREILARTRLYEQAAMANSAPELARVLRAFEQSLTPLADERMQAAEVRADAQQLSFEFTALLTRIGRAASDQAVTL